jgi:hypothetical protein
VDPLPVSPKWTRLSDPFAGLANSRRMINETEFLPSEKKSFLSKMDGYVFGLLAAPVMFGLSWYDMLNIASGVSSTNA